MPIIGICASCQRTVTTENMYLKKRQNGMNYYICDRCGIVVSMIVKKCLEDMNEDVSGK